MRTHNHKKTIWRSIVSGFLAAALVLTTCAATFAPLSALADADTSKRFISQYDSLAQMYNAEAKINVEVAAEGMVLLKTGTTRFLCPGVRTSRFLAQLLITSIRDVTAPPVTALQRLNWLTAWKR